MGEVEELREFIHQVVLHVERFTDSHVRALDRLGSTHEQLIREMRREFRDARDELRDLREEGRAQRQVLLRLLDRLGGGAATA